MATATGVEAPIKSAGHRQASPASPALDFRWRVVDDPPPAPAPTRYQRLYTWLYEFNRY